MRGRNVNNWLGRSNYSSDNTLNGSIDEFRIYDHAFTADEALQSFLRGPDVVAEPATAFTLMICLGVAGWCGARRNRRRR
jgi:hypothetical protein